jgi:hypothetical protein
MRAVPALTENSRNKNCRLLSFSPVEFCCPVSFSKSFSAGC